MKPGIRLQLPSAALTWSVVLVGAIFAWPSPLQAQHQVRGRQAEWTMMTVESDGLAWIGGSYHQIEAAISLLEDPGSIASLQAIREKAASVDAVLFHNTYVSGRARAAILTITVQSADRMSPSTVNDEFADALALIAQLDGPDGTEARSLGWRRTSTAGYAAARVVVDLQEPSGRHMRELYHFVFHDDFTHVFQMETYADIFDRRAADLDRMLRTLRYST